MLTPAERKEDDKPLLHQSMLSMYLRCGMQFYYRYVEGKVMRPGYAIHIGSTLHRLQEFELTYKVKNDGELIDESDAKDACRDLLEAGINEYGLKLDAKDIEAGERTSKGAAIDTAVSLAGLYHKELAPIIEPLSAEHIEMPWQVEYDGFAFDLAGTMDVVTKDGIRDLKTKAKTPNQADIDNDDQLSMYALGYQAVIGELPRSICYDSLIKTKTPKTDLKQTLRTDDDIQRFTGKLEAFGEAYKKGVFLPASQQGWWCSKKWCGYFDICKYSLRPKQFKMGK